VRISSGLKFLRKFTVISSSTYPEIVKFTHITAITGTIFPCVCFLFRLKQSYRKRFFQKESLERRLTNISIS
jgi:hypothetical protein